MYADLDIDPRALYGEAYFAGEGYPDYSKEKGALQVNFRRRLRTIARYRPPGRRLLEMGSAYGYFLETASSEYDAHGVEISEAATAYARAKVGVDVQCADFLAMPDPPEPDTAIVCMWDVIEHLERPDLYLEKARRRLMPSGLLAVTTGDISSLLARVQGSKWRQMCPPHHLHFFSPATLSRLLRRLGFEILHISHPGFVRTYKSAVSLAFRNAWARSILTLGHRLEFTFLLNTYDLMFVIARA